MAGRPLFSSIWSLAPWGNLCRSLRLLSAPHGSGEVGVLSEDSPLFGVDQDCNSLFIQVYLLFKCNGQSALIPTLGDEELGQGYPHTY